MTKKKIIAFLTAICSMASAASLPASACYLDETTFIDGYPYYLSQFRSNSLIVETDGTELTMDMLAEYESISDVQVYEVTVLISGAGTLTYDFTTDKTAYTIKTSNTTQEERVALARSLMLEHDFIKNVHTVTITARQTLFYYHDISIFLEGYTWEDVYDDILEDVPAAPTIINGENMPELADYQQLEPSPYEEETLYVVYDFHDEWMEMKADGMKDWEIHQYFCDFVNELNEKYGESIDALEPYVGPLDAAGAQSGSVTSVWTDAGDPNSDGEVNAADAAEMLVSAAQIGTGAEIAVTSAADVNADGTVDASDAAAVLSYAAAKGTGADVSWIDILRK